MIVIYVSSTLILSSKKDQGRCGNVRQGTKKKKFFSFCCEQVTTRDTHWEDTIGNVRDTAG